MLYAKIDLAASGTVVAAAAGKKIRVVTYLIVAAGAVTAKWQSHVTPTDLTGAMTMATGTPIHAAPLPEGLGGQKGHFETLSGEALDLTLGSGVQVSGHLGYELVS